MTRQPLHGLPGDGRSQTPHSQSPTRIPWSRPRNGLGLTEDCKNPTTQMVFGITTRADGQLIGTVGLREINTEHCHAEMGFWIGVDWWGNGYAREAANAVIRY